MNFTEQEAIEALGSKVEALNQSLTPQSYALVKHLLKYAKEDQTLDSFIDGIHEVFVGFAKQSPNELSRLVKERKLITEKDAQLLAETAVEDYAKSNLSNEQNQSQNNTEGEQLPSLNTFEERLRVLEEENENLKTQKALKDKEKHVFAMFKDKGIEDKDWLTETMGLAPLNINTDIDSYVERGVKLYNRSKSIIPRGSATGGSGSGSDKADDFFSALAELGTE